MRRRTPDLSDSDSCLEVKKPARSINKEFKRNSRAFVLISFSSALQLSNELINCSHKSVYCLSISKAYRWNHLKVGLRVKLTLCRALSHQTWSRCSLGFYSSYILLFEANLVLVGFLFYRSILPRSGTHDKLFDRCSWKSKVTKSIRLRYVIQKLY